VVLEAAIVIFVRVGAENVPVKLRIFRSCDDCQHRGAFMGIPDCENMEPDVIGCWTVIEAA
jgi:hypothetical protein